MTARTVATWALGLTVVQVALGFTNIALNAPGWMQLLHLLTAQLMWTCFLLLFATPHNAPAPAERG